MKQKAVKTGEHALTKGEYEKVLLACDSLGDRVLIMMAVSLGLRRSDIVRVRVCDVDLRERTITYHEKKKGDRIRVVPMGPKLYQEVKMLIGTIHDRETLFAFKDRQAYNRFNRLCDIAGIPRRPFHSLRATCVKFCQAAGWSPEQVSELTGDTIRVIQEHYSTPSKAEMKEIMKGKEPI